MSSHPDAGYSEQRLADHVLQVLDALRIVCLDAAADPTDFPASDPAYQALRHSRSNAGV